MKRIYSIDFTRGVVMIIMALDHVRDLMHVNSITQSPTDLSTTTPALFFSRWITYLCAPVFVFLAGTSVYLSLKNKNDISQSRNMLIKRGIWLVVLEFTIVNFGLYFDIGFHTQLFEVIAAIGVGFIILSLLLKAPVKIIGAIGIVIIFFYGLLSIIPFGDGSIIRTVLSPLFNLTVLPINSTRALIIAYPPIPWLAIMLIGFATGRLFELPEKDRVRIFLKAGSAAILLFTILRFINIYGDPVLRTPQESATYTFLSFMNVTKYPPSLLFCLVTLGSMFLILAISERISNRFTDVAHTYGRTPMFYFIAHFYLIHFLLIILLFLQGFNWSDMSFASGTFGRPSGVESGVSLWAILVIWIAVVLALYKPCAWFGKYKSEHKHWWLSYI